MTQDEIDRLITNSPDIVIIGAGMVGLTAALSLAQRLPTKQILVVDKSPLVHDRTPYQASFDARSTALSIESAKVLEQLGLWQQLVEHATAIESVHVSDRGHFGVSSYSRSDNNGEALGYVVDNAWLGRSLIARAEQIDNIQLLAPADVEGIEPRCDAMLVSVKTAQESLTLPVSLAIVAEGADSQMREHLGIETDIHDYHQHAVIANVSFSKPHHGRAYERFTANGPVALLPRGGLENIGSKAGKISALVWTWPEDAIEQVQSWDDATFLTELQKAFGSRQGKFTAVSERHIYPLRRVLAREQVRRHMVILGNAAHLLHPVAGQGFNLALRDCESLAAVLKKADKESQNLGDLSVLQSYSAQQEIDQYLTSEISHLFNSVFTNNSNIFAAARNIALSGLNIVPPIKRAFFDRMMGKTSLLP